MSSEIDKFQDKLQSNEFRKKLASGNAVAVLSTEGIDHTKLPQNFVQTLGTLSETELEAMATVNLKAASVSARAGDMQGGLFF